MIMNTFYVIFQYEFAFKGFGANVTEMNFAFMEMFKVTFQSLFSFERFGTYLTYINFLTIFYLFCNNTLAVDKTEDCGGRGGKIILSSLE